MTACIQQRKKPMTWVRSRAVVWWTRRGYSVLCVANLDKDAPDGRPVSAAEFFNIVELPAVHGLHHVYLPKAA